MKVFLKTGAFMAFVAAFIAFFLAIFCPFVMWAEKHFSAWLNTK